MVFRRKRLAVPEAGKPQAPCLLVLGKFPKLRVVARDAGVFQVEWTKLEVVCDYAMGVGNHLIKQATGLWNHIHDQVPVLLVLDEGQTLERLQCDNDYMGLGPRVLELAHYLADDRLLSRFAIEHLLVDGWESLR